MNKAEATAYIAGLTVEQKRRLNELLKSLEGQREKEAKAIDCTKFAGCVEYRVKWLQHRRIVVDPARTPNAHREFVTYSYETDKDGNILARLPDKDNHCIDGCAYALDTLIYYKRGLSA